MRLIRRWRIRQNELYRRKGLDKPRFVGSLGESWLVFEIGMQLQRVKVKIVSFKDGST